MPAACAAIATWRTAMSKTIVVFRKFPTGEILALFPEEDAGVGLCQSYMHIGQHGGADYSRCVGITRPATQDDYKPLFDELTSIGYDLEVRRRRRGWRFYEKT